MAIITINESKCTQCNACIESCPVSLIEMNSLGKSYPEISETNESRCIYCGHCESVCPSNALTHKLSEQAIASTHDKVRKLGSEELGQYFKSRRSIRQFKSKPVEKPVMEQVLDVVRYAPTGTNRQFNQWIIINDEALIQKLAEGTIQWMRAVIKANPEMASRIGMPMLVEAWGKGFDRICRKAPCLAVTYTMAAYPVGPKDAVIAASHMELLLPSFGLSACWAGYLMVAMQQSTEMKKLVGLDESFDVHAVLMIGYPKYQYATIPNRNGANVKWL